MVRKTKEDAEITRQNIIRAAREVFLVRGVSRTTMEHIASQANVTRGAVYWHFKNKTDLFHAMREQVFLPLIDRMDDTLLVEGSEPPLTRIENFLHGVIQTLEDSVETRQTYEIMMIKCEYVDDMADVLQQIMSNCSGITEKIALVYERAKNKGHLREGLEPAQLAQDTNLFFTGLLHMWVKDLHGRRFREQARTLIESHMALRRN
ncbi:MAG: TetR family transcriptional regulator [Methylophilaceae bacterium]|jgi:TetR/AcrR family acrAB operon transcriptional repressor|nr:TetR family transcriptional regulator [Methylophilaceae bacterium]